LNPNAAFFESMLRAETPILNQYCQLAPPKTFIDSIGQKLTFDGSANMSAYAKSGPLPRGGTRLLDCNSA
jgi:hypothetical protein